MNGISIELLGFGMLVLTQVGGGYWLASKLTTGQDKLQGDVAVERSAGTVCLDAIDLSDPVGAFLRGGRAPRGHRPLAPTPLRF